MYTLVPISAYIGRRLFREEGDARYARKSLDEPSTRNVAAHESVLIGEVTKLLKLHDNELVLDATVGMGGHSEALLSDTRIRLIGLDADPHAIEAARARLLPFGVRAILVEGNFKDIGKILTERGIKKVDKAIFDLGWNRTQLTGKKGFSFLHDEPLDMSYGNMPVSGFTAQSILNTWSERGIADMLFGYGEERYARRIAKKIVELRRRHSIERTGQLVELIRTAVPKNYVHGRTHFATKTFQALRIAVNDELRVLENGLRSVWELLSPGGRIAVISFHSIEDRIVKKIFKEFAAEGGALLTKKPITPSVAERQHNPSSRSAKLRGLEKNRLF